MDINQQLKELLDGGNIDALMAFVNEYPEALSNPKVSKIYKRYVRGEYDRPKHTNLTKSLFGDHIYERIYEEFLERRKQGLSVPEEIFMQVPIFLNTINRDGNLVRADYVQVLCERHNFQPTETMREIFSKAAAKRLKDENSGTFSKIVRDSKSSARLTWVAHLIAAGNTLKDACRKAAVLSKMEWPDDKPTKASSIEKEYSTNRSERVLRDTDEQIIKDLHKNDPELAAYWRWCSDNIPECESELIGERR